MSLREWFADREVLLTGVTSVLGRSLLEKLLRAFPEVRVHCVLRTRDGMRSRDRVHKAICGSPGFERVHQEHPDALSRVEGHEGNLVYEDFGASERTLKAISNVSVVIHAAGPHKMVLDYCHKLPKLEVVVVAGSVFRPEEDLIVESVMEDDYPNDLPLGLVRFSLIGPPCREPMPGYVETIKSPTALMIGAGYMYGRGDLPCQITPADVAANSLIAAVWDVAKGGKRYEPAVYNAMALECSWGELIEKGIRGRRKFPYTTYSMPGITSSKILHWIVVMLFEWLPAFTCDVILYLFWVKRRISPEHNRIRQLLKSIEPQVERPISVQRRKIFELMDRLSPKDQDSFPLRADIDVETYILCTAAATRKYCADESNLRIARFLLPVFFALVAIAYTCFYYYRHYYRFLK